MEANNKITAEELRTEELTTPESASAESTKTLLAKVILAILVPSEEVPTKGISTKVALAKEVLIKMLSNITVSTNAVPLKEEPVKAVTKNEIPIKVIPVKVISLKVHSVKASITVEAAYILPIVIFAIFAVIYLAFYLHDYCILQNAIDMTSHKASLYANQVSNMEENEIYYEAINSRGVFYQLIGDTSPVKQQILENLKKELGKRMFLYRSVSIQAEVNPYNITISLKAKAKISLPIFGRIFQAMENTTMVTKTSVHRPAETIRGMEVIMSTAAELKGVSDLKEKLEKFTSAN